MKPFTTKYQTTIQKASNESCFEEILQMPWEEFYSTLTEACDSDYTFLEPRTAEKLLDKSLIQSYAHVEISKSANNKYYHAIKHKNYREINKINSAPMWTVIIKIRSHLRLHLGIYDSRIAAACAADLSKIYLHRLGLLEYGIEELNCRHINPLTEIPDLIVARVNREINKHKTLYNYSLPDLYSHGFEDHISSIFLASQHIVLWDRSRTKKATAMKPHILTRPGIVLSAPEQISVCETKSLGNKRQKLGI